MKRIRLTQGFYTLVDDEDFASLSKTRWYVSETEKGKFYVKGGSRPQIYLHRFLMGSPKGKQIDHIDGDKLNNQKNNLRIVTHQQNQFNRMSRKNTSSIYKGLCLYRGRWVVQSRLHNKNVVIGRFKDEKEAALAYDEFAIKNFGEYARTNFGMHTI